MATLMVLAKAPVPGTVKTRLCPPCAPSEAAEIAAAALLDTFEACVKADVDRRLLVLDGDRGVVPAQHGFEVTQQVTGGLGDRLEAAFRAVEGPAVLIAMDTPQVTADDLDAAMVALDGHEAVLGLSADGGFWIIGFRSYVPGSFTGVPMSAAHTGAAQLARLRELGCSVAMLHELFDIDTALDLDRLVAEHPTLRTSREWARMRRASA
jgi:hypothetical protein